MLSITKTYKKMCNGNHLDANTDLFNISCHTMKFHNHEFNWLQDIHFPTLNNKESLESSQRHVLLLINACLSDITNHTWHIEPKFSESINPILSLRNPYGTFFTYFSRSSSFYLRSKNCQKDYFSLEKLFENV